VDFSDMHLMLGVLSIGIDGRQRAINRTPLKTW
jgi:hypothetical protein